MCMIYILRMRARNTMISIVSDASISLTEQEAQELNIRIVPMNYTVGGMAYLDTYADSIEGYTKIKMGKHTMSTSQPSVESFKSVFSEELDLGHQVLCFCISSRLSGTFYSAQMAAKELSPQNVKVIDTLHATASVLFLVLESKRLIQEGKSLEEIYVILEKKRFTVGTAFSVENLEPLKKSGRLSLLRQSVSTILNLRPILEFKKGILSSTAYTKGKKNQLAKLLDRVPKEAKSITIERLGNETSAKELAELVKTKYPHINEVPIKEVGAIFAIHLGIPSIGIAWEE